MAERSSGIEKARTVLRRGFGKASGLWRGQVPFARQRWCKAAERISARSTQKRGAKVCDPHMAEWAEIAKSPSGNLLRRGLPKDGGPHDRYVQPETPD